MVSSVTPARVPYLVSEAYDLLISEIIGECPLSKLFERPAGELSPEKFKGEAAF